MPQKKVDVAIVGAGPRGTSVLERVRASVTDALSPSTHLTIHVIDPSPPGAGNVWRTDQSSQLIMNTVTSQVTLFPDESVDCLGPICPGPTLYTWLRDTEPGLGPNDYPTRAQYGRYLEWVFTQARDMVPHNVKVVVHAARAVRLADEPDGRQTIVLSTGDSISGLGAVVLTQGHLPLVPDLQQQQLTTYAEQHGLCYIPPAMPADVDLSAITSDQKVLLRGLGLSFFDYLILLTEGRGGRFVRTPSGLQYHPSGAEPHIYASSRRGIPYLARGDNAKGPYGRHMPLVLTGDVISSFRKRAEYGDAADFKSEIWPLIAKEVEMVYYEGVLGRGYPRRLDFRNQFLKATHNSPEESQLLDRFGIPMADRWSWDRISRPYGARTFTTAEAWRDWLLGHLREDALEAAIGNVESPTKAALDVLRDLRNEVRLIVDHGGISGDSRRKDLDREYTPLNAYLSIGPPRQRVEQLIALMKAGVVAVIGPQLKVWADDGAWFAESPEVPGSRVRVTALVEARVPEPDLRQTADELLADLLRKGQCRPHTVGGYETTGLDVTSSPYRLINNHGVAHPRRFALGVPTEGVHWVTAAGARPGVNSITLCDTDAVAWAALYVAGKGQKTRLPAITLADKIGNPKGKSSLLCVSQLG